MVVFRAVIFDLDGTLVQTEELKAISYAQAAVELRPDLQVGDVIAGFDDLIGRSRNEVAQTLVQRFGLEAAARARAAELGAKEPWEAFVVLRLRIYEHMLRDPELLRRQAFPYAIDLLHKVKGEGYPTGLATMSYARQANVVIDTLGFRPYLDVIVTRDEVQRPKPDPEIYTLCAERLGIAPPDCLVIEDSQPGVEAAVAAGMTCVAVASDLTRDGLHAHPTLPRERLIDDPKMLDAAVTALLTLSTTPTRG
jgi:HAD superfamily hydrolase (TIGR01509 family)